MVAALAKTIHLHGTRRDDILFPTAAKPGTGAMTDEDRQLLTDLRRMADVCGQFCAGVIEGDLSRDAQLATSAQLADMAHRIHTRALNTPVIIDSETV